MEDNNKKVDGIKKLSKDDLVKSRQIVLETIGEVKKEEPKEIKPVPTENLNKVDSLVYKPKKAADPVQSEPPNKDQDEKKMVEQRKRWQAEMEKK